MSNPRKRTYSAADKSKTSRKIIVLALGTSLLAQPVSIMIPTAVWADDAGQTQTNGTSQTAAQQQLTRLYEEMITSGAKRIDYKWLNKLGDGAEASLVHVIEIDLTNPNVKLDVMNGKPNTVTGYGSVGSMVANSGAVAGVNADFFNTSGKGVPMGAQVNDGVLVESPSQLLQGMYAFAVTAPPERKPMIDLFDFQGTVTAADGATFPLAGINKEPYTIKDATGKLVYSHADAMYIYTSAWTAPRPDVSDSSTTPTEVLVVDGVVQKVVQNGKITDPIPANGYILRAHGKAADFVMQHLLNGAVKTDYTLVSQTTGQQVDPSKLQMLVGGHTILVDQGKAAAFSRNVSSLGGDRARTAVGYSQDGTKAYLITVEDSGNSEGVTLTELQQLMVQLGVWKGVDLDGGGSTTMVTRPLGDFNATLTHDTEYGTVQRKVVSGIGVYSTAPQGQLKGIKASGSGVLFIGQQASYELKAYDTYYNPVDPGSLTPVWRADDALGTFQGSTFTAVKAGKTTVTVKAGNSVDKLPIEVIGGDQISQMSVNASSPVLEAGKSFSVPVSVTLDDGRKLTVPASSVKWDLRGFAGTVQDGTLTVQAVNPQSPVGYAIARYDGFSAVLVLSAGTDKKFEDFENTTYPITFQGTNGVVGSVNVVTGLPERETTNALALQYDFTNGTGTKAAYAVLNGSGRKIDGAPSAITLDVMGDSSLNWLRAEFIDNNGKSHLVTLAKQVDWSGWKQLKVDLPADTMAYPVTLKRLYVASLEEGQDERAISGTIYFDNISFQYPATAVEPKRASIQLKIGSKTAQVDGTSYKMDVTPLLLNGTTYLPMRFVAEAMGAQIDWDQQLKRVSVLRGDKLLEMRIGQTDFILNGTRMKAEVAPITRSGRTLVPIRLVSEQLGLKVNWDGKLGLITIE